MKATLEAFLDAYERKPWSPGGQIDCCLVLAEWAVWLGYPDPAVELRGAYEPGQGQIDIMVKWGGAISLITRCAQVINAQPVEIPSIGCVGVVGSFRNVTRQFGVIHDGGGWLTRTPSGFERITATTLAAWKI